MNQIKQILDHLTLRQKISILVMLLAIGGGISWFLSWKKEGDFKPIYTNLAAEDAGGVLQKIKEAGVEYRLDQNGSTILVPSTRLAELRLALAKDGLPKTGRLGFEIFDKNNFGTTDFAEHVNYRRALEGELERSIMSLAEVETARVHLTFPKDSVFTEARQPAKGSVLLSLKAKARLSRASVSGIAYLVASAVEGLTPESVAVVDRQGNVLNKPQGDGEEASTAGVLGEYRQNLERDLLTKINQTLEPVLGTNKFRSGVSVDCDLTTVEESEEILDPNRSVMVSEQKSEESTTTPGAGGVPGTANNLPRPPAKPASLGAGNTRRTENVSYQTSRKVRHVKVPKGTIRRISVAVLLDQSVRWEGQAPQLRKVVEPPSAETMKVVREMVTNVAGLNADRGDQITVETLPFDATLNIEPPPPPPAPKQQQTQPPPGGFNMPPWLDKFVKNRDAMNAAGGVGALVVSGTVIWFFLRRRKRKMIIHAEQATKGELPPAEGATPGAEGQASEHALEGPPQKPAFDPGRAALALGPPDPARTEILVNHVHEEVRKDTVTAAKLLRTWMAEAR